MTANMLKFLTQKLKSQSLNEISPMCIPTAPTGAVIDSGNETEEDWQDEITVNCAQAENSLPGSTHRSSQSKVLPKAKSVKMRRYRKSSSCSTGSNTNSNNNNCMRDMNNSELHSMQNTEQRSDECLISPVPLACSSSSSSKQRNRSADCVSIASSVTSDWSRTSFASVDFDASDDELISINSDKSREGSTCSTKRKRSTALAVDEEVEALFNGDSQEQTKYSNVNQNLSFRPVQCCPSLIHCGASPRKRHRSANDRRPYLDLEKMQHEKAPTSEESYTARSKTLNIRCLNHRITHHNYSALSSTDNPHMNDLNSRLIGRPKPSALFCPLPPVEHPTVCYS